MIISGNDSAITLIMKARTVPSVKNFVDTQPFHFNVSRSIGGQPLWQTRIADDGTTTR
jgi:hypothetical protein